MAEPTKRLTVENDAAGAVRFRRWLIDKLKASRWARTSDEALSAMAKRIGVQPDLLAQAQRELDEDAKRRGRRRTQIGAPNRLRGKRRKVEVQLPERIYEDWVAYGKHRGMAPSLVLRGLIHDLLSGPRQPTKLERTCFYRGKKYQLTGYKYGVKWPFMAKTDVTEGAARALTLRAAATGTTVAGLLRGLVLDLLEGRVKRVTVISGANAMFDDETRYWTLEN